MLISPVTHRQNIYRLRRDQQPQKKRADSQRLRQYVQRWVSWLHGGLQGAVTENRFNQIGDYVKNRISAKPD